MTALPFRDGEFDVVASQFGVMFAPDRPAAFREARRVTRPGGRFVFFVWDSFASNPLPAIADRVVEQLFPADPPRFYRTPWGFYDPALIERLAREGGFSAVLIEPVRIPVERPTARGPARGMVEGSPILGQIIDRGGDWGASCTRSRRRTRASPATPRSAPTCRRWWSPRRPRLLCGLP